ncbi:hypothetical protein SAMN05444271_12838 [Halohasta litchfieldiae]|uniref:Uncharacterized protein n=3 Tax=Haloferacaceae TaxID=1644056 RepID=B9LVH1_HALLT|nr:hypothetical protein [Halorubrum lacusprofundi]ACM58684.1 hypothetical protein Hlac_3146 [Halorubrum lacusprofundi ATCC 49239]AEN07372.1 hypothetical protein Halar_0098 [halophilic archaeon DL31]SEJ18227.1 hypothetical protein SAMN05444271_12838 [Halohasta litchfieldiae]
MTEDQSRLGSVRANRGIDRRKFMKSLGAIGISGAGLNTAIGKARATPSRDRVRIVTHRSKGEPVRTKQVPKEWFEQKERARRGQQLLFNRLEESSGVLGVGYGPSNAAVDNYRFFEVRVHVDRSEGTNADIPEEVDGVPVAITRREEYQDTYYNGNYDPVPGGVEQNSSTGTATSTARVDYGGNLYLMGARHLWVDDPNVQDSCSTQDPTGENAYQSDDYYGHVKHHFQDYDAALTNIEADDQEGQPQRDGFTDTIVDENGYIEGYVDSNGIDDMMANNLEVRKRGITTGPTTGVIEEYLDNYCSTSVTRRSLLHVSNEQQSGDSGGPVYDRDYFEGNYYLFMVSLATQATGASEAVGSTAHSMANNLGIQWRTR